MTGRSARERVKHLIEAVPRAVYKGGGLKGTAGRAWRIFRQRGFSGVLRSARVLVGGGGPPLMADASRPDRLQYREWVKRHGQPLPGAEQQARVDALQRKASGLRFVVFVDAQTGTAEQIGRAMESLRRQSWPHWECRLCRLPAGDAGGEAAGSWAADARVSLSPHAPFSERGAADDAVWWIRLDGRDALFEDALLWVAEAALAQPQAALIYADEDRLTAAGERTAGYFKPAWNLDLLRAQDYMSRLAAFRSPLLAAAGGLDPAMGEAQHYDLVLRCTQQLKAAQIVHVPRVLYHRHVASEGAPDAMDPAEYVPADAERALAAALAREQVSAKVERTPAGLRVRYALPERLPLVSLIIPTRNGLSLVRQCVRSIFDKTDYPNYEIILVDNGSDDAAALAYFEELARDPRVRVLRDDGPFNYSALNNQAAAIARGEVLGLINNDIEVISPDWLSQMVGCVLQPGVGAVGAALWYANMTLQHGGVVLGYRGGVADHAHRGVPHGHAGYFGRCALAQNFTAVTGACLIVRKDLFEAVGALDAVKLKVAYNDVDLCLRLHETGARNVWLPSVDMFHHESATRPSDFHEAQFARFKGEHDYMFARWATLIADDPAYSPNLTLDNDDFSLAWPPRAIPSEGRHG